MSRTIKSIMEELKKIDSNSISFSNEEKMFAADKSGVNEIYDDMTVLNDKSGAKNMSDADSIDLNSVSSYFFECSFLTVVLPRN